MIDWLKQSNRWKHIIGGVVLGLISYDWYCATLAGMGIASALEYKDRAWGGSWEWIDWGLTIGGVAVGFGHVKGVKPNDVVTTVEAEHFLKKDLELYEAFVNKLCVAENQGQFDALVDFCFNLGCSALERSTLLKKIKSGCSEAEIRKEFGRWVHADGKRLPGLVARRKWEADRFLGVV